MDDASDDKDEVMSDVDTNDDEGTDDNGGVDDGDNYD